MIFIDNKYSKWYYNITSTAKARVKDPSIRTETHHIIPESFFKNRRRKGAAGWLEGNPNSSENLVLLTPKEHFVCHVLLTKCTQGVAKSKMVHALIGMKRKGKTQGRYINSRLYETAKIEFSKIASQLNLGRKHSDETKAKVSKASASRIHSDETKAKISVSHKGKKKSESQIEKMKQFQHTPETKEKMRESRRNRASASAETRAKMSAASKGRPKSEETKLKMSASAKGKPKGPMSAELKQQISNKLKGRPSHKKGKVAGPQHTPESKQKIIESNKRRVYSEETRAKISAGVKAAKIKRQSDS
jgi:hypothetical protein